MAGFVPQSALSPFDAEMAEKARAETARRLQAASDACRFRASDWMGLQPWQRFAIKLALAVEERDPEMALNIRDLLAEQAKHCDSLPCPLMEWWEGILK